DLILFSFLLLVFIFLLIRRKKIREEYAILWIVISLIFLFLSIFRGLIDKISSLLGIQYQPASLFLILIGCLFLLMFHFSLVISDMKKKINALAMTLTILEESLTKEKENSS
ncbi:MAG: DUF2304 domain-containing protein, partial [Candidatus Aminicenantes bacterium]|nr:DUF2304 domain-containing protein [Candidatus Aminicenantes bacterium]